MTRCLRIPAMKHCKVGRELERLNYFWYEAPLPPDDVDGYAHLSQRLDIPLTVELLHKHQYAEYVRRQRRCLLENTQWHPRRHHRDVEGGSSV